VTTEIEEKINRRMGKEKVKKGHYFPLKASNYWKKRQNGLGRDVLATTNDMAAVFLWRFWTKL